MPIRLQLAQLQLHAQRSGTAATLQALPERLALTIRHTRRHIRQLDHHLCSPPPLLAQIVDERLLAHAHVVQFAQSDLFVSNERPPIHSRSSLQSCLLLPLVREFH